MRNKTKILFFLLLCIVNFTGCIDEPVAPETYTIKGAVYPPGIFSDIYLVSINEYPIVSTATDGSFELQTKVLPFNLTITDYMWAGNYSRYVSKFQNLTAIEPDISFDPYSRYFEYPTRCYFKIYFPKLTQQRRIFYFFVSSSSFSQREMATQEDISCDSIETFINIASGEHSISGRMYFLEASINQSTGEITSYDNFGYKEITVTTGNNVQVRFDAEEIAFDPPDRKTYVSFDEENQFYRFGEGVMLSIPEGTRRIDCIITYLKDSPSTIIVPVLPINGLKIKLMAEYSNGDENSGFECVYAEPGDPLYLEHNETVTILSPAHLEDNINDNSVFEISDIDNNAVYEYNITGNNHLKLYTTQKSVKFSDFKARLFYIRPLNYYRFYVKKYPGYASLNNFVDGFYFLDYADYNEITKAVSFKTAP